MKIYSKTTIALFTILSVLIIQSCTPVVKTRGNMIETERLTEIKVGETSRKEVLKLMGSPTTRAPFDPNTWYYIGRKTEKKGILDPKTVEQQIIKVRFNKEAIVEEFGIVDAKNRDIAVSKDKTHTAGNDVTILQQIIGNVGKFNTPQQQAR